MKCIAGLNARLHFQDASTIVGSFKKVCLERLKGDTLGDDVHSAVLAFSKMTAENRLSGKLKSHKK